MKTLKKHRAAIGYTLDDLKGISPTLCQHKIRLEKDVKPVVDHQRRLNPKMKEVVRNEILKLLEAGIIYPIVDSQWVSPVHCVPKKGGITVFFETCDSGRGSHCDILPFKCYIVHCTRAVQNASLATLWLRWC